MAGSGTELASLSIACVIHSLNGGGAERVMAGLSSRLSARGHQVSLITFDDALSDRHEVDPSVHRIALDLDASASGLIKKIGQIRARHRAIRGAIASLVPDVVLSFCDRTNIDVLLATGRSGIPVVACERSDPRRQSLGFFWNSIRKQVYERAATVVALTDTSAAYLRSFAEPVVVIPSAIDPPLLTSNRQLASKEKLVVGAGRLEREKGFDRLLEAFANVAKHDSTWRLVIYGEGSQRQSLLAQSKAIGVEGQFELPGWVRPLAEPLSRATVFCLSSHYEGFPSALLEAMSLGVPSIAADCESGPRAILQHGRNGLLVESSVEGLCEGLWRMMNDVRERERMGQAATTIVERFSWDAMLERYESTLWDVVVNNE